jgi:hypothetical protein
LQRRFTHRDPLPFVVILPRGWLPRPKAEIKR